jgi:hypothetical protein
MVSEPRHETHADSPTEATTVVVPQRRTKDFLDSSATPTLSR